MDTSDTVEAVDAVDVVDVDDAVDVVNVDDAIELLVTLLINVTLPFHYSRIWVSSSPPLFLT